MKFFKKLKSGNFWVSLISAIVLISEVVFEFEIKTEYLNQILLGIMGILTLFGIVSDHGGEIKIGTDTTENSENKTEGIKEVCETLAMLVKQITGEQPEVKNNIVKEEKVNVEKCEEHNVESVERNEVENSNIVSSEISIVNK